MLNQSKKTTTVTPTHAIHNIFASGADTKNPFHAKFHVTILYPTDITLPLALFEHILHANQDTSDTFYAYMVKHGGEHNLNQLNAHDIFTFNLAAFGTYESYCGPTDHIVCSSTGNWGALCSVEQYAIYGSTNPQGHTEPYFTENAASVNLLIRDWRKYQQHYSSDITWLYQLLHSVYGWSQAEIDTRGI